MDYNSTRSAKLFELTCLSRLSDEARGIVDTTYWLAETYSISGHSNFTFSGAKFSDEVRNFLTDVCGFSIKSVSNGETIEENISWENATEPNKKAHEFYLMFKTPYNSLSDEEKEQYDSILEALENAAKSKLFLLEVPEGVSQKVIDSIGLPITRFGIQTFFNWSGKTSK